MVGNVSQRGACSHPAASAQWGGGSRVNLFGDTPPPSSHACLGTSCKRAVWVRRSQSSSQETLQFTYHIQTASVLSGCHFHSDPPPSPPAFIRPPCSAESCLLLSFCCEPTNIFCLSKSPEKNFIFFWWLTSSGDGEYCLLLSQNSWLTGKSRNQNFIEWKLLRCWGETKLQILSIGRSKN